MDLKSIFALGGSGLLVVLFSIIKVPSLEINIWGWLATKIGNAFNRTTIDTVNKLDEKISIVDKNLKNHIYEENQNKALERRRRVLRFNDEILAGIAHTKEHFDEILSDIDEYEKYCKEHPEYPNNKAVIAIEHVKKIYQERLEKNDFL